MQLRIQVSLIFSFLAWLTSALSDKTNQLLQDDYCLYKQVPIMMKKCGRPDKNDCASIIKFAQCSHKKLCASCDVDSAKAYVKTITIRELLPPGEKETDSYMNVKKRTVCMRMKEYIEYGGPNRCEAGHRKTLPLQYLVGLAIGITLIHKYFY